MPVPETYPATNSYSLLFMFIIESNNGDLSIPLISLLDPPRPNNNPVVSVEFKLLDELKLLLLLLLFELFD